MHRLDEQLATRFARMVLGNVLREYPNHIMHVLNEDADVLTPRILHPAFYGCYDWHSSVHSHWLLVRLLRLFSDADFVAEARRVLDTHLTPTNIAAECRYLEAPHRAGFERPYGLAWLLQLSAELHEWPTAEARNWRVVLVPLEMLAVRRFSEWLPKLSYPIRSGEHANLAFALGLVRDYAHTTQNLALLALIETKSREFYSADVNTPLAYEPSGQDFLSPVLAEADLMRRLLPRDAFAHWLSQFMPQLPQVADSNWLSVAVSQDPSDGKFAHLDGLNLSRAWMCEAIAGALPENDPRRDALLVTAAVHTDAGLAGVREDVYAGSHWLPSFAVYLLTRRDMQ